MQLFLYLACCLFSFQLTTLKIILAGIEETRKNTCVKTSVNSLQFQRLRIRALIKFIRIFLFLPLNVVIFLSFCIFMTVKGFERFQNSLIESISRFQFIFNSFEDFQLFSLKKTFLLYSFFCYLCHQQATESYC